MPEVVGYGGTVRGRSISLTGLRAGEVIKIRDNKHTRWGGAWEIA